MKRERSHDHHTKFKKNSLSDGNYVELIDKIIMLKWNYLTILKSDGLEEFCSLENIQNKTQNFNRKINSLSITT
jgi:hypothetical protein